MTRRWRRRSVISARQVGLWSSARGIGKSTLVARLVDELAPDEVIAIAADLVNDGARVVSTILDSIGESTDPASHPSLKFHAGLGVPFNGYCPCAEVEGGIAPSAIGRSPAAVGTATNLFRYTDGISVMFNVNSNQFAVAADLQAVANEVHEIAAATR